MANDNTLEGVSWPVNELGELILTQGSGSGNIVGQVPLSFVPVDARTGTVKAVFAKSPAESATPTVPLTLYLSEGRSVTFTGNSAVSGVITKYKANGTVDFTATLTGNAVSSSYGPYSGLQLFTVTCTSGSIDSLVANSVLSSAILATNANNTIAGIVAPGGGVIGDYVPTPLAGGIRNFTLANTARIRKMRSGGRRRVRIVFLGDSLFAGTGSDDNNLVNMRSNGMCALLAKQLTAAGIPARQDYAGGTGSVNTGVSTATLATIDPRLSFVGGTTLDGYKSLGGNMIRLNTTGDSVTFTPGNTFDTVELLFAMNTSGQGNFAVTVDGQTAQVVADNASVGVGKATLTFAAGRAVTITKGLGVNYPISIGTRTASDPCVEIINGGSSGEQLANLATFPGAGTVAYVPLACLTAMLDSNAINIVILNGWANDYLNGATALQSATYINTLLNQIRLMGADTVYVNYAALDPTNSISQSVQDAYSAQCIATAIGGAAPSGVIDLSKLIPSYPIGNAAGLYWDPKHLGSLGQAYATKQIARAVLGVIPSAI